VAQSKVELIIDAQNAIIPLQRVNKQTQALSNNTNKLKGRLDRSSQSLQATGRSAKTAAGGFSVLTKSIAPLLKALAVIGTARFILFQTAQLETQTKALEVLTGSAETAQDIVQEIKEFGAVTPFKSSELIEVAKRMKAFGFETENVVDITKRIADIAGTAGADIDGVALAIGKVQAKNKFMQEENIMLLEKGINVTKDLEEITGLTGEALADAMSKGEIGADKFVEAIVKATSKNGQFFEGASKQSDTLAGKFSTFVDNVETFAQNLGKIFEDPLKEILDSLNEIAGEFNKLFSMLGDAQIGASNRQVGSAVFKARLGMQDDAVRDIEKAVNLLDPAFVRTEEDAAKLAAQIERIQKAITLIRGADSLQVLEGRGLAEPLINATLRLDEIKRKGLENVKAQKQLTIEAKKTNNAQKAISNTIDKNKNLINLTSFAFTEDLVPDSGLFAQNLDLSNVFLSDMTSSSVEISAFFRTIKTDAELVKEKFAEIGDTIGVGISDALVAAINGTKSLAESARSILNDLANTFLRLGINSLLKKTGFGIFSNLPSFAKGGSPPVGRPSIVGEKGPEIFVPRSAGTIIANDKISGSGVVNNINISVDATGSSVEGDEGQAAQLGKAISQAIQAELVQQKRQGGLLYS
tara:strand:- start:361 stop:2280 length:1920 start_codon:yes stop_codon:yes gene_type:complete